MGNKLHIIAHYLVALRLPSLALCYQNKRKFMHWLQDFILVFINLTTSIISAVAGMGGGMILVGLMPLFLPAAVIIPVHGATQLASNASRTWFGRDMLDFRYFPAYAVGSLVGAVAFGVLVQFVSLQNIPIFIAGYILLTQWSNSVSHWLKNRENFYIIGFLQTGIGMFVGSPGPLQMPLLLKKYDNMHTVVTVSSLFVSFFHVMKLIAYVWLGFSFREYWQLIVLLAISSIIGSWLGVRLRHHLSMPWLKRIMPWLMTIIAIKIIISTALKNGWLSFFGLG